MGRIVAHDGPVYFLARIRHETSQFHVEAVRKLQSQEQELVPCKGLKLDLPEAKNTVFGNPDVMPVLQSWVNSGCIAVTGSVLDTIKMWSSSESLWLQDVSCLESESPCLCMRAHSCCKACFNAANRTKAFNAVQEWAKRIAFVELAHILLADCADKEQAAQVDFMLRHFPELEAENLREQTYHTVLTRARLHLLRVPTNKQSNSLRAFLSRSLRYLTPTMLVGVGREEKRRMVEYLNALESGKLQESEANAIAAQLCSVGLCFSLFL